MFSRQRRGTPSVVVVVVVGGSGVANSTARRRTGAVHAKVNIIGPKAVGIVAIHIDGVNKDAFGSGWAVGIGKHKCSAGLPASQMHLTGIGARSSATFSQWK